MNMLQAFRRDFRHGVDIKPKDNGDFAVYGLRSGFVYVLTNSLTDANERAAELNKHLVKA